MQDFSPFASPYKVRLESDGQTSKTSQAKDAAWLRVLGKDTLPIAVLQSRLNLTHNISVVLKSQGMYHICNASPDIATAPGLQATQQSELGLTFAAAVFTKAPQKGHSQRQAGAKRGRPARQEWYVYVAVLQLVFQTHKLKCFCLLTCSSTFVPHLLPCSCVYCISQCE